ncbi:leishmanolysin-like peptidase [Asterias rubens]|uniref:leishmanolysin-like peptidase n=1 Tax=Asterias rubens TaxID=7604 RepID=UPI001455AF3D|nr:leishmanolysin-like peptidase [Asterias rubens]
MGKLLYFVSHLYLFSVVTASVCVHRPPGRDEIKYGVHLDQTPTGRLRKRSASHPLRIHVEYEDDVDKLPAATSFLVKNDLLPAAVLLLSRMLNVWSSATGPVRLNRACAYSHYYTLPNDTHEYCLGACGNVTQCGPVTIPNKHLHACYTCDESQSQCKQSGGETGPGVADTDFILYVTAEMTSDCLIEDTTAHASFCQLEATLDRPIAGYINLCPSALSTDPSHRTMQLTTVQHEIIHSLGFTAALYAFYHDSEGLPFTPRDPSGLPPFSESLGLYQWSDRVIKELKRTDWDVRGGQITHTIHTMVTPNVRREARAHFDCPVMVGMEVENNGGYGTKLTHFEKRLLENEAMTGTHTHERVFSRLTLAVLEDTGWYQPNYDMADPLDWGKGLGCDFVRKSCKYWMDKQRESQEKLSPFCDVIREEPFTLTCSVGRKSVALCNLHQYSTDLDPKYQYFDSLPGVSSEDLAKYGGTSELADYCPFHQQFNYKEPSGAKKSTTCQISANTPSRSENVAAEYYGMGSTCVEHGVAWRQSQCDQYQAQQTWGAGCYQYSCGKDGLKITIEGVNYLCSWEGQSIAIRVTSSEYLHTGKIVCPSCQELCGSLCPRGSKRGKTLELTVSEPGDEGECPKLAYDSIGVCSEDCIISDQSCGYGKKCCSNGCGHRCMKIVKSLSTDEPCPGLAPDVARSKVTVVTVLLSLSFTLLFTNLSL